MPITQERMLALIAAADDLQQAVESAELFVKSGLAAATRTGDYQGQLESLSRDISLHLLLINPTITIATIAVERRHFAINKSRNEAARRWHERRRREDGILPLQPRDDTLQVLELSPPLRAPRRPAAPPPPRSIRDATGAPLRDLSYDEDDPENALGEALLIEEEPINPVHQRMFNIMKAPEGHKPTVAAGATSTEDRFVCQCGLVSDYEGWKGHLSEISGDEAGNG